MLLLKQNRGAYWNKGAYSIRVLTRTGALTGKTDSREALSARGLLFPSATNAWQELLCLARHAVQGVMPSSL